MAGLDTRTIRAGLDDGYTLPAEWYTSGDVFAREHRRIFGRAWQYVGLTEQVAQPGDFFTTTLGEVPVLVVRDQQGALRAWINVCRHRGSTLVLDARGSRKTLQCHYHAWTYNLDGTLRAAPGEKDEPGFDRANFPLIPAQVAAWGPFIFVNPDRAAPAFESVLGELPRLVDETGLPLGAIRRRVRREYEIAANWKVGVDNYLECYHCHVAHPSFSVIIELNSAD
ncbi:MAG: aromatic ring-hydroxylating oxygenase subunit alpha, partial [Ktedonobacterales bacterium]